METEFKFNTIPYQRVTIEEYQKEAEALIAKFKSCASGKEQLAVHKEMEALVDKFQTACTVATIRHDANTVDPFYKEEQDYYDKIYPQVQSIENTYRKLVYESPFREELEAVLGKISFQRIEFALKSMDETSVPLMQEENALVTRYQELIASAKIQFHGEELNLSLLQKYLKSADRNVRKEANAKQSEFFLSIADELDEIYDQLVKNRTAQANALGYSTFTELGYYRMNRISYDRKAVETFRDEVKKYLVPVAEKLHDKRRQRLGLEKLSFIDENVYFPYGNPAPKGTAEDIFAAGKKMYSELSPETKEFFDYMLEHDLFEVLGRKNKNAGGYMTTIADYDHAPFIYANFNGTSGDVDVITHECGHAFQGFITRNYPYSEYNDIAMETAETHSMSMEFFTEKYMEYFFGDKADDYRTLHIEDAFTFIPYGCMVDEFQHIVYDNPNLTPNERKREWQKLEKQYKPHLNYEDAFFGNGGFWQKQSHIYCNPFYYIDYCLAQTSAFQFKLKMDEDYADAWKKYLEFCKESAKEPYGTMLHHVGLKSPLEEGCVREISQKIEERLLS
ncbi:MAG: M3 family oligoendopeptidase [Lachnospiraceae bacterium]